MVHGAQPVDDGPSSRRVEPQNVAGAEHDVGLVDGGEALHPIGEAPPDDRRVVAEAQRRVAAAPAAGLLQRQRQVEMVETRPGLDARGQKPVDETIVEVEALGIGRPAPLGHHPGPGDREAVGAGTQPGEQLDVLGPAVIVVAGHGRRAAVGDPAGLPHPGVPDAGATALLAQRTLDLEGRGGSAPEKARGKSHGCRRRHQSV